MPSGNKRLYIPKQTCRFYQLFFKCVWPFGTASIKALKRLILPKANFYDVKEVAFYKDSFFCEWANLKKFVKNSFWK